MIIIIIIIIAMLPEESTSTSGTSAHSLSLSSSSARSCDGFPGNIGSEILGKVTTTECDIQCRDSKSEIKHIFALIVSKPLKGVHLFQTSICIQCFSLLKSPIKRTMPFSNLSLKVLVKGTGR